MSLLTRAAFETAKGRRDANEDAIVTDPGRGIYLLADGTGGRAGGKTAATIACDTLQSELKAKLPGSKSPEVLIDRSIALANQRVLDRQSDPALHGMATTAVIIVVQGDVAHIAHVGDSRAYLWRQGRIIPLTRDHSLANYLADHPELKAKIQRPGNTVVRAIGLHAEPPKADHRRIELMSGDVLMACSDGVSAALADWLVGAILGGAAAEGEEKTAKTLLEAALAHGTMDNVSAIVIRAAEEVERTTRTLGWLTFLEGPRQGQVIALGPSTVIGADPEGSALVLSDGFVSGRHAELIGSSDGFVVRDLGSRNGTFLNETRISEETLVDGDALRLGGSTMVFKSHRLT